MDGREKDVTFVYVNVQHYKKTSEMHRTGIAALWFIG
jgi:hypothetical protein